MALYEFAEQGRKSKAWWLRMIKDHGRRGVNPVSKNGGVGWMEVNDVIAQLVQAGFVKAEGKATRKSYELSSFGHRYLEEHKSELPDDLMPVVKSAVALGEEMQRHNSGASQVHQVPPTPPTGKIPMTPVSDDDVRPAEKPLQAPRNTTPPAETTPRPAPSQAVLYDPARAGMDKTILTMRDSLGNLLMEKHGKSITALELIDFMEAENAKN